MPYTPAAHGESAADAGNDGPPGVTEPATASAPRHAPAQELQVRRTAQRLLTDHLRRPRGPEDAQRIEPSPEETFWPGTSLDLTGATLVDFDLSDISVTHASFARATFSGDALFGGATFSGDALFEEATFSRFTVFFGATFSGDAVFGWATFSSDAVFGGATFSGDAVFGGATFSVLALFGGATFCDAARFDGAIFSGIAEVDGVRVFHLDDPELNKGGENARRVWPEGWTVRPNADDRSRGTLVPSAAGSH
jgi:uncharacterized protein YjbI with pentapeptide repeats